MYTRIASFIILLVLVPTILFAQSRGRITGIVVDAQSGETLVGVNVFIEGTLIGKSTDLDGNYTIDNVEPGSYTLVASYISYNRKRITEVVVVAGQTTRVDFTLEPEALDLGEVTVTATVNKSTDAGLLSMQRRALAIQDGISAQQIANSASSSAADALGKVTGASVVDSKYIYVRGLGDRYSNAELNGSTLPSNDPNRNTVQMDMFPANLLENIVTLKTFTPDKPGNFTGGSVNISTKKFPDETSISVSTSTNYNTQSSLSNDFLTYSKGSISFLGSDNGIRKLPAALQDPNLVIPTGVEARFDNAKAQLLDELSKSLSPVMSFSKMKAPIDKNFSISMGTQSQIGKMPIGVIGSLTYSRDYQTYSNGTTAQYQLTGKVSEVNELNELFNFNDSKSTEEILWGGLVNVSIKPSSLHEISANYMVNRSGNNTTRYQFGTLSRDLPPTVTFETRTLAFTERKLDSYQLSGRHVFPIFGNTKLEWSGTSTNTVQDEPDLRFFSNDFAEVNVGGNNPQTIYKITPSVYPVPTRLFRNLQDDILETKADLTIPFRGWTNQSMQLKIGGLVSTKSREFTEFQFNYRQDAPSSQYKGDPEHFFSPENTGIIGKQGSRNLIGNHIVQGTQLANNYNGDERINAVYGMIEVPITERLKVFGGARFETTDLEVQSLDTQKKVGKVQNNDILPSANILFEVIENMNIRVSYSKTLARPTFRELAPFSSFDFVSDFIFTGNPDLKRTLVTNYDARFEWYVNPGELLAVSAFYKDFVDPIERAIVSNNNNGQYQNVDEATVYGVELEARKDLKFLPGRLSNLAVSSNLALIHSSVDLPQKELDTIRELDPNASGKRPLQGQSPFVLNLDVKYDDFVSKTNVSLGFNMFGERLSEVSLGGTPNVYEESRPLLNMTVNQTVFRDISLKLTAKNLLDTSFKKFHRYKDNEFVTSSYRLGRTLSLGVSYQF